MALHQRLISSRRSRRQRASAGVVSRGRPSPYLHPQSPLRPRPQLPGVQGVTVKQLKREAIRAHAAGMTWDDWWPTAADQVRQAEPWDRQAYHRLMRRLLGLLVAGDLDGQQPVGDVMPWDHDDERSKPAEVGTAARCLCTPAVNRLQAILAGVVAEGIRHRPGFDGGNRRKLSRQFAGSGGKETGSGAPVENLYQRGTGFP